jgi:hypothetical protein
MKNLLITPLLFLIATLFVKWLGSYETKPHKCAAGDIELEETIVAGWMSRQADGSFKWTWL